jgi:hypothetical protein
MVAAIRKEDLRKVPGVTETLDWAATLAGLEVHDLRRARGGPRDDDRVIELQLLAHSGSVLDGERRPEVSPKRSP